MRPRRRRSSRRIVIVGVPPVLLHLLELQTGLDGGQFQLKHLFILLFAIVIVLHAIGQ